MNLTNTQKNDYALPTAPHWAVGIGIPNIAAQPHPCGFFVSKSPVMTDWAEHSQEWLVAMPVCQLRSVCLQVIGIAWRQVFNLFSGIAIMKNSPLVISNIPVRQDSEGRYCLNDLHKASGSNRTNQPYNFSRLSTTKDLQAEIEKSSDMRSLNKVQGVKGGTYACKELVYAYAMWISASFSLKVIRAYDALTTEQPALPSPALEQPAPYQKQPFKIGNDFETARERMIKILEWTSQSKNEALHDDLMSIYWCMDFAKTQMNESAALLEKATEHLNRWR